MHVFKVDDGAVATHGGHRAFVFVFKGFDEFTLFDILSQGFGLLDSDLGKLGTTAG